MALAPVQCVNNHLFTTGFLSPLWIQDYVELTGVVFGRKNKAPPSAASFLLPALHPPSPSLLIFMDLSANGHRTRHPFHIRHLSSRYPNPLEEREGTTHHLVLFTLLCGVLMSSPMISLDITSAQHAAQQQCRMASLQAHDQPAKKDKDDLLICYYSSKHKLSQVITHELHYSFKFDALRGSNKLFFSINSHVSKASKSQRLWSVSMFTFVLLNFNTNTQMK